MSFLVKACFVFIFTSQGASGLPGPKVIKCILCHPGFFSEGETAELLKNYCL